MFIEIFDNIPSIGCNLNDIESIYEGCECCGDSSRYCCYLNESLQTSCSCLRHHNNKINPYKQEKVTNNDDNDHVNCVLNVDLIDKFDMIIECSDECKCDFDKCLNRLSQKPTLLKDTHLEIFDCERVEKGKGVRTKQFIQKGTFICEYMGELIGGDEARRRYLERTHEPNYILLLREHITSQNEVKETYIDAKNYSNIGRYINHSCEPNLILMPIRHYNLCAHAGLYSIRDIQVNEELCYNYDHYNSTNNNSNESINENNDDVDKKPCYCMSVMCKGYLPINKKFN